MSTGDWIAIGGLLVGIITFFGASLRQPSFVSRGRYEDLRAELADLRGENESLRAQVNIARGEADWYRHRWERSQGLLAQDEKE